jgi:hypothetical protein
MKKTAILSIILLLFSLHLPVRGQDFAPVGTAVAQFLEIGIGARAVSLGEAYTAVTNDAGSVFWNPAGLVDAGKIDLYTSYNTWPADLALGGLSLALNLGRMGTFAFSSVFLMSEDMEITTMLEPGGTGNTFNLTNTTYGLSYARYLTDRVSVGATAKLVQEKYGEYGYSTWALNIGTLYRTSFRGLTLGMSILHFGPEVRFSGEFIDYSDPLSVDVDEPRSFETYSLPINFRLGASIHAWETGPHLLVLAGDMVHPNNNLEEYNFGFEYSLNRSYFLRGGYQLVTDEGGLSLGAGARLNIGNMGGVAIHYAFSNLGILTSSHQFTLILSL